MNTTTTAQAIVATVAHRTECVAIAEAATTPRARKAAWAAVEAADQAVRFATQDHEIATRVAMKGAAEVEIQTAARAA